MAEIKKEFETLIEQVTKEIERFNNAMYELPEIDGYYSELVEDIRLERKLKKKELHLLGLNLLKEKFPKFIKLLDEMDVIADAMTERIGTTQDKYEEATDKLDEVEELKEEYERRKDELD